MSWLKLAFDKTVGIEVVQCNCFVVKVCQNMLCHKCSIWLCLALFGYFLTDLALSLQDTEKMLKITRSSRSEMHKVSLQDFEKRYEQNQNSNSTFSI